MTLADLRRFSIRKQSQIRFRLRNGMECVVTEHGVAQVPALDRVPDFNLEEELAFANEFLLEPAPSTISKTPGKKTDRSRPLGREELSRMLESSPSASSAGGHDDE